MHSESTIRLSRSSQLFARIRSFTITLDEQDVGTIQAGKTIEIPVQPGSHAVRCSMKWGGTASAEVNIQDGQKQSLECGFNVGFFHNTLYLRAAEPSSAVVSKLNQLGRPWWQIALLQSLFLLIAAAAIIAMTVWYLSSVPALTTRAESLADRVAFAIGSLAGAGIVFIFAWNYLKHTNDL